MALTAAPPQTPQLGREGEMETLRQWLTDPASRLITLLGPGGVGKTRLVLELARATAEDGGPKPSIAALIQDIDRALGSARPHGSPES